MMDWFSGLERREQVFVAAGGAIAAVILLWGAIWLPIDKLHSDARAGVDQWQRALIDLRIEGARLAQSPGSTAGGAAQTSESAVVIVDRTLRDLDLNSSVTRRQPTPNGIRVEFEAVPFDELAVWLGEMSTNYAMEVQAGNLSIASVGGPGRINASLTLERSP
jgi:general secretion pathway protein M